MTLFLVFAAVLTLASAGLIARSLLRAPARANASSDELNAAVYRDHLAELERAVAEGSMDAAEHAHAREAIRRRLAEELQPHAALAESLVSRGTAFVATALLVAGAGALYAMLGTPAALSPQPQAAAADPNAHGLQAQQILAMVERLGARLKENPDDVNGWVMLGRSYSALGRFDEAARGYAEAVKRSPTDPNLLADHADVLAMAQGRRFDGEPDRLIARALQADANHVKALALAGTSAFGRKEYARAVEHWSRLRQQVPAESDMARSIESSIRQASALAAGGATPVSATATSAASRAAAAPAAGATVSGTVVLAPAMAQRVKPGDTLFVYARSPEGSRMPLAIVRQPVGAWPAVFTLDDSSAMSPASRLSGQPQVVLEARVSRSGSATPVAGDLRGTVGPVALGEQGVRIEIGAVVQ